MVCRSVESSISVRILSKRAKSKYMLSQIAKTMRSLLKVLVYKSLQRNTGIDTVLANKPIRQTIMETTPERRNIFVALFTKTKTFQI